MKYRTGDVVESQMYKVRIIGITTDLDSYIIENVARFIDNRWNYKHFQGDGWYCCPTNDIDDKYNYSEDRDGII